MDQKQSYRLLRMCHSLFKSSVTDTELSVARDLYDFVEENTTDKTLKYQMGLGRITYHERHKTLYYLNHRLNIGLTL